MFCNVSVLVLGLWLASTANAHAYIDPGTGSMLLQAAIGAIASTFYLIRVYWSKLKGLIVKRDGHSTKKESC